VGATGPDFWPTLDPAFEECGSGTEQSPRNFNVANVIVNPPDLEPLRFKDIPKGTFSFKNLGFTLSVEVDAKDVLSGGGLSGDYDLVEFHYHRPGEHKINGLRADLELQFVHENNDGDIAVVAVLFNTADTGSEFLELNFVEIDEIPEKGDEIDIEIEPYSVFDGLPRPLSYFNYVGSLTNPPCTEPVDWFILTEVLDVSEAQLSVYKFATGSVDTFRPQQINTNPVRAFIPDNTYFA
jgi:carbonic anhydrase